MKKSIYEKEEKKQLADECFDEGMKKMHVGDSRGAEAMFTRAKELYAELEEKRELAKCLNLLSIVYGEMGNEAMDLECLLDAAEVAIEENATDLAAKYINNVGSKYQLLNDYTRAMNCYERSLELYESSRETHSYKEDELALFELILFLNLATTCSYLGDKEKTKLYYEKAKAVSKHPANVDQYLTFMAFEGLLLWRMGERELSNERLDRILEKIFSTPYIYDFWEVTSYVIDLLEHMNEFDKWKKLIEYMEKQVKDENSILFDVTIAKNWIRFYEKKGDKEKYQECCVKFCELSKLKEDYENAQRAENIEVNIQFRYAEKAKTRVEEKTYVDPLTGIGNRNRMLEDSREYIEKALESGTFVSIGLIDIDYFKECNDTYGHIKGDECLRQVAGVIREVIGDAGSVYRFGGDEFLILLLSKRGVELTEYGRQIKEKIDALAIPNEKAPIHPYVTVSQGYTNAFPDKGDSIETLVNLADRVLYSVKRAGRDNYKYTRFEELINKV